MAETKKTFPEAVHLQSKSKRLDDVFRCIEHLFQFASRLLAVSSAVLALSNAVSRFRSGSRLCLSSAQFVSAKISVAPFLATDEERKDHTH